MSEFMCNAELFQPFRGQDKQGYTNKYAVNGQKACEL